MGNKFIKTIAVGGAIAAGGYAIYKRLDQKQQVEIQNEVGKLTDEAKVRLVDAQYAINDLIAKAGLDEQAAALKQKAAATSDQVKKSSSELWQKTQDKVGDAREAAQAKKDEAEETIVLNLDNLDAIQADATENETILNELDHATGENVADDLATIEAQVKAITDDEVGLAESGKQALSAAKKTGLADSGKSGLAGSVSK
ncbi:hypothetical protein D3P96_04730 [Weissella viridescens]|uniref:Uncharacterized protein n=1 Tax=Weissella viridescens TaxID=1629 RepID=A0A3P2RKK1_WEIVI|nr:hypothetical protein [Weissella viridescens]RRG17968.1 hypothetical protein D3P96_04730 [Weissella viridescens]